MMIDVRPNASCAETFEPVCFGPWIERARRLVENDNRRAPQKRARERDALPLTDAELRPAGEPTAQQCLFFIRQTRNDLCRAGGANCGFELGVRRCRVLDRRTECFHGRWCCSEMVVERAP